VADLGGGSGDDLEAKYMGICRRSPNDPVRRIGKITLISTPIKMTWKPNPDILCVPYEYWGGALLYFTGDAIVNSFPVSPFSGANLHRIQFNRSMRLLANRKGMSLNQRGLWEGVTRDPKGKLKTCAGM